MQVSSRRYVKAMVVLFFMMLCVTMLFGVLSISSATGAVGDTPTNSRPDLNIKVDDSYWASMSDYAARELSVDVTVTNDSAAIDANGVAITGSSNTGGVTLSSATPLAVGDIDGGNSAPATLMYHVPMGVIAFSASITGSAMDTGLGNTYYYPTDPSATLVYSANVLPAAISVIDVDNQSLVNNFFLDYLAPTDQQGHFMSVSPDGLYLWVSEQISATGGYVAVLDASTGEELKHWDVGAGVGNHMSRDGSWLFVASNKTGGINVFDVQNQTYLGTFAIGSNNHVMDSDADATELWIEDAPPGYVGRYDITGLPGTLPTPIGTVEIGGSLHALLLHPNGDYVFVGSSTSGTNIVDISTMSVVKTFAGGMQESPHNYTISPDQNYLLVGDTGYYT
ncbi:MAG: YncE family protein [Thermoleophilia bacterium]